MAETKKAHARRLNEGFYDRYIKGKVIDIGAGIPTTIGYTDAITTDCECWDLDKGDATFMKGVQPATYDTVYTSHILEHINDPITAIKKWFEILKPKGHLIISVPHRDLYERRKTLPSKWNGDHKFFILPEIDEAPHTKSLKHLITTALMGLPYSIKSIKVQDTCTNHDRPNEHGNGEYSIEAIIYKKVSR